MKVFRSEIDNSLYVASQKMCGGYCTQYMKYYDYPNGKWFDMPAYKEKQLVEEFEDISKKI